MPPHFPSAHAHGEPPAPLSVVTPGITDGFEAAGGGRVSAPVGPGARNHPEDVRIVQARLRELRFPVGRPGLMDRRTSDALRLFHSIILGTERRGEASGMVQPGSDLEQRLFSPTAPKWARIPSGGPGWKNIDSDHHDWATEHLIKVLDRAGEAYQRDFLSAHPRSDLIQSNDASTMRGGDTPDHESHENGLDLDLRLPSTDGKRTTTRNRNYDRAAALAQVRAFAEQPEVSRVLISDRRLIAQARATGEPWAEKVHDGGRIHENHVHIDLHPPAL